MKRALPSFLAVLMLMFLTSCSTDMPFDAQSQETIKVSDSEAGEVNENGLQGESPTVTPRTEEVEEAYQRAMEAFFWFYVTTMPGEDYDSGDSSTYMEADGTHYVRVNHNTIKTSADLENYLHLLFAGDIVTELLERGEELYRDFNGALYTVMADRGTSIFKGEETLTITQESDLKFTCAVQVELLDFDEEGLPTVTGYEVHEYCYEFLDGQWIFTNFHLFR